MESDRHRGRGLPLLEDVSEGGGSPREELGESRGTQPRCPQATEGVGTDRRAWTPTSSSKVTAPPSAQMPTVAPRRPTASEAHPLTLCSPIPVGAETFVGGAVMSDAASEPWAWVPSVGASQTLRGRHHRAHTHGSTSCGGVSPVFRFLSGVLGMSSRLAEPQFPCLWNGHQRDSGCCC